MVEYHKEVCRERLQGASSSDIMKIMGVSQQVFQECVDKCRWVWSVSNESFLNGSFLYHLKSKRFNSTFVVVLWDRNY